MCDGDILEVKGTKEDLYLDKHSLSQVKKEAE